MHALTLKVVERGVRVACADPRTRTLLTAAYGAMLGDSEETDLEYTVGRGAGTTTFFIERRGREPLAAPDDGTFLALFDEDIAIELQKLRPDLYFVHAAVLKYGSAAVMLVAKSGGGKSTLCWALLHHGFRYVSDELAPVDLHRLEAHPYPRALILKRAPPSSYPLAAATSRTSRGFHVRASDMPGEVSNSAAPLAAIFFLRYSPEAPAPSLRRITGAEATARLYANALNPLAHGGSGLDAAVQIATARPCFELVITELGTTCALVVGTLGKLL